MSRLQLILSRSKNDILFIKGDFIEEFIKRDLNKLPDGIKVITHNSDVNITEEFVNVFKEKILVGIYKTLLSILEE